MEGEIHEMSMNDLKALIAANLLAGSVRFGMGYYERPTQARIAVAVEVAQQIWDEVIRQDGAR